MTILEQTLIGASNFLSLAAGWLSVSLGLSGLLLGLLGLLLLVRQLVLHLTLQGQLVAQVAATARREDELAQTQRIVQVLSGVNAAIADAQTEEDMLAQACTVIVQVGGYPLAWIGMATHSEQATIRPVARAGAEGWELPAGLLAWSEGEGGGNPLGEAFTSGQPRVVRQLHDEPLMTLWGQQGAGQALWSLLGLPLQAHGHRFGILCLYSSERDTFRAIEVDLFMQLATTLSRGLYAWRTQTSQHIVERILRTEQAFAQLITATSPVGIMVVNQLGAITFVNPAAERLLGCDRTTLLWRGVSVLQGIEAAEGGGDERKLFATIIAKGGSLEPQQRRIKRPDGQWITLALRAAPLPDSQGQPQSLVLTLSDVTSQVALESTLAAAQHVLEQRVAERTHALADVNGRLAHELAERRQIAAQLAEREEFVQRLADALPSMLLLYDLREQVYLYTNRAITSTLGYSQAEFSQSSGNYLSALIHADDQARHQAHLEQLCNALNGETIGLECRVRHQNGSWRWLNVRSTIFQRDRTGTPRRLLGIAHDSSDQRHAEQALYESNQQLQRSLSLIGRQATALNLLSELVELLQLCMTREELIDVLRGGLPQLFAGTSGAVALCASHGASFSPVLQWGEIPPPGDCQIEHCWAVRYGQLYASDSRPLAPRCRHAMPRLGQAIICMPIQAREEVYGVLIMRVPSLDSNDQAEAWLRNEQERLVSTLTSQFALSLANLQLRASLQQMATRDPLTGLLNRRALDEALLRELRRAERTGQPCGLIILDIDHFKQVNDTDGHAVGDLILQRIAALLAESIRTEDVACRYGGEEFVIVLPTADLSETARRAEELRRAVLALDMVGTGTSFAGVTISLGVAAFPTHGTNSSTVIAAADTALYAAKRAGRNRVALAGEVLSYA